MKYPGIKGKWLTVFLFLISCLCACEDDVDTFVIPQNLMEYIYEGNLLLDIVQQDDEYELTFETGVVTLPAVSIESIEKEEWRTTIFYQSGKKLEIPSLGKTLDDDVIRKTVINPSGHCPLSVLFQFSFPVPGRVRAIVEGKTEYTDIQNLFPSFAAHQEITVLGLYPDYENTVTLVFTDKDGNERLRKELKVKGESLKSFNLLDVKVTKAIPEKIEEGMTLINYLGANIFDTFCPFMVDADGEIRWILDLRGHKEIGNIQTHTGIKRIKNGNILCGDVKTSRIIEMDMTANVLRTWDLKSMGYEFHHEVIEMPSGNFLILVSGANSYLETGELTISDMIIELDRETGKITNVWDLKKSLDPTRNVSVDEARWDPKDWSHNNAVIYSKEDDCILVSSRYQGLIKLDRKNNVKWILAPHRGWDKKNLSAHLLSPLDASGNPISDQSVKSGEIRTADFDWTWGGHSPVLMPDGNILLFDNGYYRHFDPDNLNSSNPELYSRSVEYKIDEKNKTIQQVWQYGEERKHECYSAAVSSTQYLPENGHILFCPGFANAFGDGKVGGRVVEVDKKTNEVVFEATFATPNLMAFHRALRMTLYP